MLRRIRRPALTALVALLALMTSLLLPAAPQALAAGESASYTVMVYLNGSDLESEGANATLDLLEMMRVGSGKNLNIVVETMGTRQWFLEGIRSEYRQRWQVNRGRAALAAIDHPLMEPLNQMMAAYPEGEGLTLVQDKVSQAPVSDPAALTDFITWAMASYPADRYVLVMWNHGGGAVTGYGHDELAGGSLQLDGIQKALADAYSQTGQKLDLVGFDACLMATVEVAGLLSPYAGYLLASEELEPGHGWNYTTLQILAEQPDTTPEQLGKAIADGFRAQAEEWGTEANITLSLTDLSKVGAVITALEAFLAEAADEVDDVAEIRPLAEARRQAESYGQDPDYPTDMVDVGDLVRKAQGAYPDEAAAVLAALDAAVVYQVTSPGKPDGAGLSIFMPYSNPEHAQLLQQYQQHTPFSDTYKAFARTYAQTLFEGVPSSGASLAFLTQAPESRFTDEGTVYTAQLNPDGLSLLAEVSFVLGMLNPENEDQVILLNTDTEVDFDPETGLVEFLWPETAWALNGQIVPLLLVNESERSQEFMIPALLNDQQVLLVVIWDREAGEWAVVGAWPGVEESGVAQREIIKLQIGDRITPLFPVWDEATGDEFETRGAEFELTAEPVIEAVPVPAGAYVVSFEATDFAGGVVFTDWAGVELGDITAPTPAPSREVRLWVGQARGEVNGQPVTPDVPPQLINGRTMVPLRFLAEALGASVEWIAAENSVVYTRGESRIQLWIGRDRALVNGVEYPLDVAPVLQDGRTLVPLRFVSQNLGAAVEWIAAEEGIVIRLNP